MAGSTVSKDGAMTTGLITGIEPVSYTHLRVQVGGAQQAHQVLGARLGRRRDAALVDQLALDELAHQGGHRAGFGERGLGQFAVFVGDVGAAAVVVPDAYAIVKSSTTDTCIYNVFTLSLIHISCRMPSIQ